MNKKIRMENKKEIQVKSTTFIVFFMHSNEIQLNLPEQRGKTISQEE